MFYLSPVFGLWLPASILYPSYPPLVRGGAKQHKLSADPGGYSLYVPLGAGGIYGMFYFLVKQQLKLIPCLSIKKKLTIDKLIKIK